MNTKKPAPHDPDQPLLNQLLGYNLRRASVLCMTHLAELLKPWNLSPTEFSILLAIEGRDDVTQALLCRSLSVKGANMTPMISSLEKQGFVKRAEDPGDRRKPIILMTPAAQRLMPQWKDSIKDVEHRLQGPLTRAERVQLICLLQKIWMNPAQD
jgi:DNA-binding MarR family transcriptional regulator